MFLVALYGLDRMVFDPYRPTPGEGVDSAAAGWFRAKIAIFVPIDGGDSHYPLGRRDLRG